MRFLRAGYRRENSFLEFRLIPGHSDLLESQDWKKERLKKNANKQNYNFEIHTN